MSWPWLMRGWKQLIVFFPVVAISTLMWLAEKTLLKANRLCLRLHQTSESGLRDRDGIGPHNLYGYSFWATGAALRAGYISMWAMRIKRRILPRTIPPTGALQPGRFIQLQELRFLDEVVEDSPKRAPAL